MDYSGNAVATCANKHSFGKLLLRNDFNIGKDVNSDDTWLCCNTTQMCIMLPVVAIQWRLYRVVLPYSVVCTVLHVDRVVLPYNVVCTVLHGGSCCGIECWCVQCSMLHLNKNVFKYTIPIQSLWAHQQAWKLVIMWGAHLHIFQERKNINMLTGSLCHTVSVWQSCMLTELCCHAMLECTILLVDRVVLPYSVTW